MFSLSNVVTWYVQIHQSYPSIWKDLLSCRPKIKQHNKVDCPLRNRKHLKQFRIVLLMQTDTLMWRKEIFIWFFVDTVVFYCKYLLYFIIYTPPDALQPQQSIREVSDVLIIFPLFIVTFWDNFTYLWHSDSCHILCVYPPLRLEFLFQIWKLNKCYINLSLTQKETCWDIFYYSS